CTRFVMSHAPLTEENSPAPRRCWLARSRCSKAGDRSVMEEYDLTAENLHPHRILEWLSMHTSRLDAPLHASRLAGALFWGCNSRPKRDALPELIHHSVVPAQYW